MSCRVMLALCAFAIASCGNAGRGSQEASGSRALTLYGTTDIAAFQPVIDDFRRLHPDVSISYEELEAGPLHERYLREAAAGEARADLLISAAMDLQVKLVNDGYAAEHVSENGARLPSWARWRNEAFGITFEPVVFVFNRDLMRGRRIPRSRPELLEELSRDPQFWHARIGTYDIAKSSVGYLLASQDARQNNDLGSFMQALGAAKPRAVVNTAAVLADVERGELVLGYNVLGSYARRSVEQGKPLTIVYPQDYTLAVSRTVILPRNAPNPADAHLFLEYLLSLRGQRTLSTQSGLSAARLEIVGPYSQLGIAETQLGPLRPIALSPGLLVYLDEQKHRRLLESWQRTFEP
jgi:iron(III) transport system substrate-binding protein